MREDPNIRKEWLNMKIAVVTTHYANNYGALLQTFALQRFLNNSLGQESEVLAYYPPWYKTSWTIFKKPRNLKDFVKNLIKLLSYDIHKGMMARARKNQEFIKKNIIKSKKSFFNENELTDISNYECYICGSDQVWNLRLRNEPIFFLNFTKNIVGIKKIAYAPSVTDPIPSDSIDVIKGYLKNLDAISVRESNDVDVIQSLTNKTVYHVADPVLLLLPSDWEYLAISPKISKPYIMCYFINCSNLAIKTVKKIRKMTGYPVVYVNVEGIDKIKADYNIRDADPFEFLGYIKDASFIITNSFHCTAFSLLFKKDYFMIPKLVGNKRIESLQNKLGIENRCIDFKKIESLKKVDLPINYKKFDENYKCFRNVSIEYLKRALGVKNDDSTC
jgi:hypothetical protein